MMSKYPGIFITFEGVEGCGKSTQSRLLRDFLIRDDREVLLTREPGGPKISEEIRDILLNPVNTEMLPETEMLLYMASRSQHTGQWILPALKEGRIVISDRYYDSTIAYQGAARKVDLSTISTITEYATYGTVPDVTFLLDLPVEIGVDRIKSRTLDRLELENREFHEKVRQQYLQIADSNPDRYFVLNGEDPVELIHQVIRQKVLDIMTEKNMILVKDKTEL